MQTPWGKSDYKHVYAPGIVFYGTPGHGGIKISKAILAVMPPQYVNRSGWYEEDCEVYKVILAFPHLFPAGSQRDAAAGFARWFNEDGSSRRSGDAARPICHNHGGVGFDEKEPEKYCLACSIDKGAA